MNSKPFFLVLLIAAATVLQACGLGRERLPEDAVVPMRWDHRPEAPVWNAAVRESLRGEAAILTQIELADAEEWCPGYAQAETHERELFWTGFLSALSHHESTHNPRAVGGGGRWFGLTQISPGTARYRNCEVTSGEALLDGAANLQCALRIMAITVPRDGVIGRGRGGVSADWGPMVQPRKRADMIAWMRAQPYCQG